MTKMDFFKLAFHKGANYEDYWRVNGVFFGIFVGVDII